MVTVGFSTTKAPFDWFALGANGRINNAPLCAPPPQPNGSPDSRKLF